MSEVCVKTIREHELLTDDSTKPYFHSKLVSWGKPLDTSTCRTGFYASFKIGAEWLAEDSALVVTTKNGMEQIDFLKMFMTCFNSGLAADSYSKIYSIQFDEPPIKAPALGSTLSILLVSHFIATVNRIKILRRGYVHHEDNLHKVKGHIKIIVNDRKNTIQHRNDRVYCGFDEYTVDTQENQLIKHALLLCEQLLQHTQTNQNIEAISATTNRLLVKFEGVSDVNHVYASRQTKFSKLYADYAEAIRLAHLIMRHADNNIAKTDNTADYVTPFVIDMSLLYEHYVLASNFDVLP